MGVEYSRSVRLGICSMDVLGVWMRFFFAAFAQIKWFSVWCIRLLPTICEHNERKEKTGICFIGNCVWPCDELYLQSTIKWMFTALPNVYLYIYKDDKAIGRQFVWWWFICFYPNHNLFIKFVESVFIRCFCSFFVFTRFWILFILRV